MEQTIKPFPQRYDAFDEPAAGSAEGMAGPRFDAAHLMVILRRNLLLIAVTVAIAVAIGIAVTLLSPVRYVAYATIQIDQQVDRVLDSEAVQAAPALDDTDRFLQTQIDVIQSRAMAEQVVRRLNIAADPAFYDAMNVTAPEGLNQTQQIDYAADIIAENIAVDLPRQSRVLSLSFESGSPDMAARVANSYAETFIAFNLQRKFDSSAYAREFLSTQLAAAQSRLEDSERDLNEYARANGLIRLGSTNADGETVPGQSTTTASLSQLTQLTNSARAERIAAEQKWRAVESRPALTLPDVISDPAVQALVTRRAETSAKLQDELAVHQESYPDVVQLRAQLNEINSQIGQIAGNIKRSIFDSYRIAASQENALEQQVSGLTEATLGEQDRSVRYNILAREADTNRSLYDGLLQRFREVSAEAGITSNNVTLVDRAGVPEKPTSPRPVLNILIALLAGLVGAAALVFAREQMDDAIRAPEDIENKLGLVPLGLIPNTENKTFDINEELAERHSAVAEAYHTLRTNLLFATPEGVPPVISLTSTMPTEGKSTTAYAIARDLADLGNRTVLLDLDLRRPSLHRLLDVQNDRGVTDVLTGQASFAEAKRSSPLPTLDVCTAGPIPPSPTRLLSSDRLAALIAELRQSYDIVIMDGPPVLGLADATILSSLSSGTVFVIEAARMRGRGSIKAALRRLRSGQANILGAVLTKYDLNAGGSLYYQDYYRYESVPGGGAG